MLLSHFPSSSVSLRPHRLARHASELVAAADAVGENATIAHLRSLGVLPPSPLFRAEVAAPTEWWPEFQKEFIHTLGFNGQPHKIGEVSLASLTTFLHDTFPTATADSVVQTITRDVTRFEQFDPASKGKYTHEQILSIRRGMQAIAAHRVLHEIWKLFPADNAVHYQLELIARHVQKETNVEIHPAAEIGAGFVIDHGTGTIIGATTKIGNDTSIYHGVTAGATGKRFGNGARHPILGDRTAEPHPDGRDNILLGNGSQILGPSVIGNGTRIGAGAIVRDAYIGDGAKIHPNVEVHGVIVPPGAVVVASTPHRGEYVLRVKDGRRTYEVKRALPAFDVTTYDPDDVAVIQQARRAAEIAGRTVEQLTLVERARGLVRHLFTR